MQRGHHLLLVWVPLGRTFPRWLRQGFQMELQLLEEAGEVGGPARRGGATLGVFVGTKKPSNTSRDPLQLYGDPLGTTSV